MKNKDFAFFRVSKIISLVQTCITGLTTLILLIQSLNYSGYGYYFRHLVTSSIVAAFIFALLFTLCLMLTIKLNKFENYSEEEFNNRLSNINTWTIIASIIIFPLGLISRIPYYNAMKRQITIKSVTANNHQDPIAYSLQRLEQLNKLKNQGIISESDYETMKSKIINQ